MAAEQRFDPYAILGALDRHNVGYIVIGAFARVVQGAEELTRGIDIVPSMRAENLRRVELALHDLRARNADGGELAPLAEELARQPVLALASEPGELKLVPEPAGTRGYDDLRRAATREPLGRGLRPWVASTNDLARMVAARGREEDRAKLRQLRQLSEFERGLALEL